MILCSPIPILKKNGSDYYLFYDSGGLTVPCAMLQKLMNWFYRQHTEQVAVGKRMWVFQHNCPCASPACFQMLDWEYPRKTEVLWNVFWLNEFIPFLLDLKSITWYNAGTFGGFRAWNGAACSVLCLQAQKGWREACFLSEKLELMWRQQYETKIKQVVTDGVFGAQLDRVCIRI